MCEYTHTHVHAYFNQFLLQSCSLVPDRTGKRPMEKIVASKQWSMCSPMYFECFRMVLMLSLCVRKLFRLQNCLIIPHRQMCIKIRTDYFFTMILFLQVIWDSVLMQIIESKRLVMSFMLLNPWMLFLDYTSIETTWKYWFMFISKFWSQTSLHHQTLFEVKGDLGLMNEFGSCSQTFHYFL